MGRAKSRVETETITITTGKKIGRYLDRLVKTELYGRTKSEVAEQLIRSSVIDLIMTDKINKLDKEI